MNKDVNIVELIEKGAVLFDVEGSFPKEVYKNVVSKIEYPNIIPVTVKTTSL